MEKISGILGVWKKVYGNWKYTLSLVIIATAFFVLNVIIKNFNSISSYYSLLGFFWVLKFIWTLALGFKQTTTASSFFSLVTISILLGMLFTLITYKIKSPVTNKTIGFFGIVGIFFGFAAPGCVACGVGLLTLLGVSATTIYLLPLKGLEISLLAIAILSFSTWRISKDLLTGCICEI